VFGTGIHNIIVHSDTNVSQEAKLKI